LLCAIVLAVCATTALSAYSFTIYGDWGTKSDYAGVLAKVSEKHKSRFIAALGDNFYREKGKFKTAFGIKSVDDPKWNRIFESVYTQPFFKKRWYVVAGNHDYNGNEKAQIEYTKKSKRWYFPSFYYKFSKKAGSTTVDFFMLDTTPLYYGEAELKKVFNVKGKDTAQIKWLEAQLKASTAKWKIVMAHHQVYSANGGNAYMKKHIAPLLEKYKVSAFINGHLHSVMHVKKGGIHYMTIGNAAFQKPVSKGSALWAYPSPKQFKSATCKNGGCKGFAIFKIASSKSASVLYYNKKGKLLKTIGIKNRN